MNDQTFAYLVFGLGKYFDNDTHYPLPDELRFALNQLAYAQRGDYPSTLTGVLRQFELPLATWWPGPLPMFDQDAALVYDRALSLQGNEYLDELFWRTELPVGVSTENFQLALDKLKFKQIFDDLQQQALKHSDSAQQEYVALRRFLIMHPWPTSQEIVDEFSWAKHIGPETVGDLYANADSMYARYLHEDCYWNCAQCGPLIAHRNELRTVKSSVCGVTCPRDAGGWERIPTDRSRRVLKRAHQLAILIPGIPELGLFEWCHELQANESALTNVELWPEIDSYDLRIEFRDREVWAIDVKDFTDPERLWEAVKRPPDNDGLRWDRAFYVFPSYRLQQRNRYKDVVGTIQRKLPRDIELMDMRSFELAVKSKLGAFDV